MKLKVKIQSFAGGGSGVEGEQRDQGRAPLVWNKSQQGFGIQCWYSSIDGLKSKESCSTPLFHVSVDPIEGGPTHSVCLFAATS